MFSQNADMNILKENETLEDLQAGGLMLIQKKNGFRFGIDAVLLADFAKDIRAKSALDLCSGSGIVPILLSHKTNIPKFFGIEIQREVADTACRSVALNKLEDRISVQCGDLKNAVALYGKRRFGLITCNPPYMPAGCGIQNELDTKIIARHEIMCCLEDVLSAASQLLCQQGHLVLVHKPSRLADIIAGMREHDIEPKRIRFIHKKIGSEPSLLLTDGAYKGGKELKILPPLYLYDEAGSETEELKRIYER